MDIASPGLSDLLERDSALEQLRAQLVTCERVCGQLALISGEAGVGKSSVLRALAAEVGADARFTLGQCDDLFTPRQLGPLYDMLPTLGTGLARALESGGTQAGLFPVILSAIDSLPPGSILAFEDVHWADHATVDLLKFIARRLQPLRVLIVLTYRPDDVDAAHPLNSLLGQLPARLTSRICLEPLSAAAVTAMASAEGRDGEELYRITGGNPFFLSELLADPAAGNQLPMSVRDAVLARASRFAAQRPLLDTLSASPEPVLEPVVRAVERRLRIEALNALEAFGLLRRDLDMNVCFRHELARRAIFENLPPHERQACHRALLAAHLELEGEIKHSLIVHHAAAIGSAELLLEHAPIAARRAAALGAHKEAASHLELALQHVDATDVETAARLYEEWAYHASLFEVSDRVFDARNKAIELWRSLDRPERVGDNLRWLWRLYWYLGDADRAEAVAAESLTILESIPPSPELTSAYALRSQMNLLKGRRAECIRWGRRALAMDQKFSDRMIQAQASITVATAMLFDGDDAGREMMQDALDMALEHGLHEEAARAYTNFSEYAIVTGDWPLAERLIREGLAFDVKHGLDAWTTYLRGRHAQFHLGRGQLEQAETLARAALDCEGQTVLMRIPARLVLATVWSLTDQVAARQHLDELLETAMATKEQQRLTPTRLAIAQHCYLRDDLDAARVQIAALRSFGTKVLRPWDAGALQVWSARLGMPLDEDLAPGSTRAQVLEIRGEFSQAAAIYDASERPIEAAMVRLAGARAGQRELAEQACLDFASLACAAGEKAAGQLCAVKQRRSKRRGPYRAARQHPLGLTGKEVEVLALMAEGATNGDIAERLSRSPRTVETHVSSILGKLNAANRLEATLRVVAEPWIVQG